MSFHILAEEWAAELAQIDSNTFDAISKQISLPRTVPSNDYKADRKVYEIKLHIEEFLDILLGTKTFLVTENPYTIGDVLYLREITDDNLFTERYVYMEITYLETLNNHYILSLKKVK